MLLKAVLNTTLKYLSALDAHTRNQQSGRLWYLRSTRQISSWLTNDTTVRSNARHQLVLIGLISRIFASICSSLCNIILTAVITVSLYAPLAPLLPTLLSRNLILPINDSFFLCSWHSLQLPTRLCTRTTARQLHTELLNITTFGFSNSRIVCTEMISWLVNWLMNWLTDWLTELQQSC